MLLTYKKLFLLFLFLSVFGLYPLKTEAQTLAPWPYVNDGRDVISYIEDVTNKDFLKVDNTAYYKLCKIRRLFCGKTQTAVIAFAMFTVGFLLVIGKLKWISMVVVMSGLFLFISAERVAISLVKWPPNLGVIYSCYCIENIHLIGGTLDGWIEGPTNWIDDKFTFEE